jgi:hypothetical protein
VVFLEICGLRFDFTERQGAICEMVGIFLIRISFPMENHSGLSPPLVDHWRCWSTVNHGHGRPKSSPELGLVAAPGHGGSPVMAQWREGSMGSPSRASPGDGGEAAAEKGLISSSTRARREGRR